MKAGSLAPPLHLVQQIRDETHRFAVTFHRQRRTRRTLRSQLEEIPGVGKTTARKLLAHFGSVANLQRAGVEEIARVVPRARAEAVFRHLHPGAEGGAEFQKQPVSEADKS